MGKLVVIEHLSLDGVMQAPGGPQEDPRDGFRQGGWVRTHHDPVLVEMAGEAMSRQWALLAGRRTYEQFHEYWPAQAPNPFSQALQQARKFVASTTLTEPLVWENSVLLKGDVPEAVRLLKEQMPENLVVFGSGELVRSLLPEKLVDEFVLSIHPVLLGSGRRLFADTGSALSDWELVRSRTTKTGVIAGVYRPS